MQFTTLATLLALASTAFGYWVRFPTVSRRQRYRRLESTWLTNMLQSCVLSTGVGNYGQYIPTDEIRTKAQNCRQVWYIRGTTLIGY